MNGAQTSAQSPVYGLTDEHGGFMLYHLGETNACPACGQYKWIIGRQSAECANCCAAVPLAAPVHPATPLETNA